MLALAALGACPASPDRPGRHDIAAPVADPQATGGTPFGGDLAFRPEAAGAIATIGPADDTGMAILAVTVRWPPRDRTVASIHPGTDRIVFELKGSVPLPPLPDLTRPAGGSLVRSTSVRLPVVPDVKLRATAFDQTGAVVGQSLDTDVNLRRNARVDVPIELLPARGTSVGNATLLTPTITGVFPDRGYPQMTDVQIRGTNFGFSQGFGTVSFGGIEAGQASVWTDSIYGGATISMQVPPGARTGPVRVRVGGPRSDRAASWPALDDGGGGDPWSGHFTVLGPTGEPIGLDTGVLGDHRLAWNGNRFWIFWTRGAEDGMELVAAPLTPDSQTTVSSLQVGTAIRVASAPGIQLGGVATDAAGAWVAWQEAGGPVKMAHVAAGTPGPDRVATLSDSPAPSAQPVLARAPNGNLMAAWIDDRHTIPGGKPKPRVYAMGLSASGTALGPAIPVQVSNGGPETTVSQVGTPSIAAGDENYLIGWQETVTDTWGLMLQAMSFNGKRLYTAIAGWKEAGAGDPQFQNESLTLSGRSLEDLDLLFGSADHEFVAAYLARIGSSRTSSDIYVHRFDRGGKGLGEHHQVADDTRQQGRAKCPSFDPGTPCGQGYRHRPHLAWNGRDYMIAWQMNRDDGELDILGARLQRDALGAFARAAEEPPSPRPSTTYPRSVAEIVFSFEPGRPGLSLPGPQTLPRLAWGADVLLIGWIEPRGNQSTVMVRLWR